MRQALLLHDLQMHSLALHFDLRDKVGRGKSVNALADLFFALVASVTPALFIEAGAKNAAVSARARRRVPAARVVAFEANPRIYERCRNAVKPGIEYLNLALSDAPGALPFLIQKGATGGQHSLLPRAEGADYETVTVDATSLDAFFSNEMPSSCCIWIDVEGSTGQVLSGARLILDAVSVLIVEVEDQALWAGQWLRPQVFAFLLEAGLLPIARDFQSRYQYNVIFMKESLLDHPQVRSAIADFYSGVGNKTSERPSRLEAIRRRMARVWR